MELEFVKACGHSLLLDGDAYMVASRSEIMDHYVALAAKRGSFLMQVRPMDIQMKVS